MPLEKISNVKWHAGWLYWGYKLGMITYAARQELYKLQEEHSDWDFEALSEKVKRGEIRAYL